MARETNDNLVRVSYLMPKQLRDLVDADAYALGFSRNNMITSIINLYYEAKKNADLINSAEYVLQKGVVIKENPDLYKPAESLLSALNQISDDASKKGV